MTIASSSSAPDSPAAESNLRLAVALSGGGHRATLFGLGALMYLVDAGRQRDTVSIASVSGGSLTNGFVGQTLDFQGVSSEGFTTRVVKPLAGQIANRGTLFAPLITKLYFLLLVFGFIAAWLPLWLLPAAIWLRVLAFVLLLCLWGWLFSLRGAVCAHAFKTTLFSPGGKATPLGRLHTACSHVICATELRSAQSVYFSGDFVYGFAFGAGKPGTIPLYRVVQASAAFPGGFPPARISTASIDFKPTGKREVKRVPTLIMPDGGVYDNMGDQWARGFAGRAADWPFLAAQTAPHPAGGGQRLGPASLDSGSPRQDSTGERGGGAAPGEQRHVRQHHNHAAAGHRGEL
jgi:predicted acylesterase/phospholipase RssA